MKPSFEILPAGAWERDTDRPEDLLTPGGKRARNQIFPMKSGPNLNYYVDRYKHTAQAGDWKLVEDSIRQQTPLLSIVQCFAHVSALDDEGQEALRLTGSYGRRNVYTDHAAAWVKVATTMLWLEHGGDVTGGAQWPPQSFLRGAWFRRIYHPWASANIIWIDAFGNHVPSHFGAAIGDDSKIIATWEELLATGGHAEGDRLRLPTGTMAGAEAIRAYNEEHGVTKPEPDPDSDPGPGMEMDPGPGMEMDPESETEMDTVNAALDKTIAECQAHVDAFQALAPSAANPWRRVIQHLQGAKEVILKYDEGQGAADLDKTIAECQAHVDAFQARGHAAANRWRRVVRRLQGEELEGDVSDGSLAEWLALSRRNHWSDAVLTLPKVIKALKDLGR